MVSRLIFALIILGFCLQAIPARTIKECLDKVKTGETQFEDVKNDENQSKNVTNDEPQSENVKNDDTQSEDHFEFFWMVDIPLKLASPFWAANNGTLNETLYPMKVALEAVHDCYRFSSDRFLMAPESITNKWQTYVSTLRGLAEDANKTWHQFEDLGTDGLEKLVNCIKGLEAGKKNWLKDRCPDYDYFISPNLTDLEGSCCKDSQNVKCVLEYISGKCDKFISDVFVFQNRVAYTLLELHLNQTRNETSKDDEKYPEKCHLLAMGSGVIGRNSRGNMSTWTLIFLALLSWAIQSAVGMIEKFGR